MLYRKLWSLNASNNLGQERLTFCQIPAQGPVFIKPHTLLSVFLPKWLQQENNGKGSFLLN